MNYLVVEFIQEKFIAIILDTWLCNDEEVLQCYWPTAGAQQSVRRNELPDCENWSVFEIDIIAKTDSYKQATKILLGVNVNRPSINKTRKRTMQCVDDSEEMLQEKRPKVCQFCDTVKTNNLTPATESSTPPSSQHLDNTTFQLISTSLSSDKSPSSKNSETCCLSPVRPQLIEKQEILQGICLSDIPSEDSENINFQFNFSDIYENLKQEVRKLQLNLVEIKDIALTNQRMLERLITGDKLCDDTGVVCLPDIFPKLPVATMDEFAILENVLTDEMNRKTLITFMLKASSPDVKKYIKSMLNILMTCELMTQFNWMGQRGRKRAMRHAQLVKVIHGAVLMLHKNSTFDIINHCIKEYLKYAENRLKGRNKVHIETL